MYSIEYNDMVMACIVLGVYISGKLWMYYRIDNKESKPKNPKSKGVIRRGKEWPE